jgi:hypothetical protein
MTTNIKVRFEVFTAETMKDDGGAKFLRNGGSYKSHLA